MRRSAVMGTVAILIVLVTVQPASANWMQQTVPNSTGTTASQLSGVSCQSTTVCMAVGSVTDATGSHVLAESRDGSTWAIQSTPVPAGSTTSQLNGVSCISASACIAVGSFTKASTTRTLAEAWNGTSWTIQSTPVPAGSTTSQLNGVSCTSASACIAVGSFTKASTTRTLAEAWNGTSWTIQKHARSGRVDH